jgi:1-phosphatidylinositol-4-phosphate 5-kinase
MAGLNCEIFFEDRLDIFITIGNTAKLATPIVLSIMRYKDPNIKKKLKGFFTKV